MPIRMTPLIDVVFILLVFFMVTSYLLPTSYLELENVTAAGRGEGGTPLPELQLTADGDIQWQNRRWQSAELATALLQAGHQEVRLATDGDVALDRFTRTLSSLDSAGIRTQWKRTPPDEAATTP